MGSTYAPMPPMSCIKCTPRLFIPINSNTFRQLGRIRAYPSSSPVETIQKLSAKGTMGVNRLTGGIFVLFVLSACWASNAREITTSSLSSRETMTSDSSVLQINYPDSEGEVKALQVISTNANKCVFLCEAFVAMALKYLKQSKTPIEIFDTVRKSCSQMGSYEQQCTTMVDRLGSQLIMEIGTMQPGFLCGKFNFSEHNTLMTSSLQSLDQYSLYSLNGCKICHVVVAEAVVQLKDPETRAAIIQGLSSACYFARNYAGMCQALVSGIGPLVLLEVERLLESRDLCTTFRVCNSTSASSPQPSVIAKPPMAMIYV